MNGNNVICKRFQFQFVITQKKSKGSDGKAQTKKPKVELSKEELNSVIDFDGMCDSMKQSVAMLKEDYSKNLNLRLSQNSIESIQVKTSEGVFQLGELGQVMQKTSNSFVVDMISSPQHIKIAMEAIAKSSLKLNPQLDKTSILIQIPKLSREHRENLSKSAKKYFEDTLSKLRDIHNKNVKKISSAKNVSADLIFSLKETVKFQFDNYVKEAETMMKAKQNELLASDDK